MRLPWRTRALRMWYRIPLALRLLVLLAAWFSYADLMTTLNDADDTAPTMEIIWGASAAGAAVTGLVDAVVVARFESFDEFVRYSSALQTGELPIGIDSTLWGRRIRRSRVAAVMAWMLFCPFILFAVLSADSSPSPYRVFVVWTFVLIGAGALAETGRRGARFKQLDLAIRECCERARSEETTPAAAAVDRVQDGWRANAETSRTGRFIRVVAMASALASIVLLVADLNSVVYDDSRTSRLAWAALCATVTGVVVALTLFGDPRFTATSRTIEGILQYDWAFRTGEMPAHVDAEQWRNWMRGHRRSYGVTLVWACFYFAVAGWSLLGRPTGYQWIVAGLLAVLGVWHIRRWRLLRARLDWLEARVERYVVRELFG